MSPSAAHILVLDDDADVAYAATLLLRRHVARVDSLAHPADLPRYLQARTPDIVLLDFNFAPGQTDGAAGLAALRQLQAVPQPPAVIALGVVEGIKMSLSVSAISACIHSKSSHKSP